MRRHCLQVQSVTSVDGRRSQLPGSSYTRYTRPAPGGAYASIHAQVVSSEHTCCNVQGMQIVGRHQSPHSNTDELTAWLSAHGVMV